MTRWDIILCLFIFAFVSVIESAAPCMLQDLSTQIGPCLTRNLVELAPKNVELYFNDRYKDGSYMFGYILKNGDRRYERGILYADLLYVEGFFSSVKVVNSKYVYETTRYTAGKDGYYPRRVEITYLPPKIPTIDLYARETGQDTNEGRI